MFSTVTLRVVSWAAAIQYRRRLRRRDVRARSKTPCHRSWETLCIQERFSFMVEGRKCPVTSRWVRANFCFRFQYARCFMPEWRWLVITLNCWLLIVRWCRGFGLVFARFWLFKISLEGRTLFFGVWNFFWRFEATKNVSCFGFLLWKMC